MEIVGEVVDGYQIQPPDPLTDDFVVGAIRYESGEEKNWEIHEIDNETFYRPSSGSIPSVTRVGSRGGGTGQDRLEDEEVNRATLVLRT